MPRRDVSLAAVLAASRSASFRRLNAPLYGPGAPVGQSAGAVAQPDAVRLRGGKDSGPQASQARVGGRGRARRARPAGGPVLRVHLVVFRRHGHELDDDNLRGGCKLLRDAIADYFRVDDSQRCIEWEYSQAHTRGREGVTVKIEALP